MMQHTSLFLFKLTSFLLTWNEQSSDQQEKHHVPVTFIAMELFSLKSSQGKSQTDAMFVGELSLRQWVSQAFPHEFSNVVDSSIVLDELNNDIRDASRPPENFSILNTYLASIVELALLCSRVAPEERIPMTDVVVMLNKIKSDYSSQLGK